jgi:hypothetical protein
MSVDAAINIFLMVGLLALLTLLIRCGLEIRSRQWARGAVALGAAVAWFFAASAGLVWLGLSNYCENCPEEPADGEIIAAVVAYTCVAFAVSVKAVYRPYREWSQLHRK